MENITSYEQYDDEQFEGNLYLLIGLIVLGVRLVIISFGLAGNIISFIIWSRPHLKSSSSIILVVLAVCDTIVILCGIWSHYPLCYDILKQYIGDPTYNTTVFYFIYNYYMQWSLILSGNLYKMAQTSSMYLTVIISVECYICICHPFRFKEWCSYSRTCKIVAITIIFSAVCHMSYFWEYRVVRRPYLVDEKIITFYYKKERTELGDDPLYRKLKYTWMFIFIDYLLPLTCIITLNTINYIKLKRINTERAMTDPQRKENKLTRMMLYVVVEFLVFTSFNGFMTLVRIFPNMKRYLRHYYSHIHLLYQMHAFFNSLNSSVNFVTYIYSWPPFRKTFIKMFCCHKRDQLALASPEDPGLTPEDTRTTSV